MSRNKDLKTKLALNVKKASTAFLITIFMTTFCYWILQLFPENVATEFATELVLGRSGDKLFEVFLLDPIPDSVNIIHSQDSGGFDGYILLHFKISPDDLNLILTLQKWQITSTSYVQADYPNVTWWNLKSLGENTTEYYLNFGDSCDEQWRSMWVNSQKNEVYFQVTFNCP
jgi:hypothetical protein